MYNSDSGGKDMYKWLAVLYLTANDNIDYYKNDQEQDPVVKVSAMKRMFRQLGTPDSLKQAIALPLAGDHVLASPIKSKDVAGVEKASTDFAISVLKWKPVTSNE